ncbi:MAG: Crp/Fnr family transcriptional regulator [Alphaproteobacteria bacterium PRO2]|nr:Crp/Fnr family transcriptional regulator [Alphaproteobacteria bacterium PRO2]
MQSWHDILIRKLTEHSLLSRPDIAAIRRLPGVLRHIDKNEDILRQGDKPKESLVVLEGMLARYHNAPSGRRQYLSFHIAGDMPDAQTLFLERMDHAVCAVEKSGIALVPHTAITNLFKERPEVGFALWKETLIDAAIFRETITNNSSREPEMRLAHFFCEQYYRAEKTGLVKANMCRLPLTQTQLAETLASSLPSISRTLIKLRKTKTMEFDNGHLRIFNWNALAKIGDFNPAYLHLEKPK